MGLLILRLIIIFANIFFVTILLSTTAIAQDSLLLSEVVVKPTAGEYVEIHNPSLVTIDLSNYYLSDATSLFSSLYYYNIVLLNGTSGGGSFSDFNAKFPNGATIAAGEFQTVALNGAVNFNTTYGVNPTYELIATDAAIPDMLEAETGTIGSGGGLTNSGEVVVFYYWNGASDLVIDIDYVVWGDKNEAVDKTGISIDGPDGDATTSLYANDTNIPSQDSLSLVDLSLHAVDLSAQRIDFSQGTQINSGGNGVGGTDQTSENISSTWQADSIATPNVGPQSIADLQPLLLSEIVVTPTEGEFVEIYNPGSIVVDLTNYYLTDATNQTTPLYYYNIVLQNGTSGGASTSDFNAKFPSGATISPGEFQTVGLNGAINFNSTFGVNPTYELVATDAAVPDMLEAETGSIGTGGGLVNGDEVVILYYWDGVSDLVQDIDYLNYGPNNEQVDKTGISIDGPDGDATTSTYFSDTPIADQPQAAAPAFGTSTQRIDFTEGNEVQTGGNGAFGSDETSENTNMTWHADSAATPNAAPQEIFVLTIENKILLSEIVVTPPGGEFVEIYNPGTATINLANYFLTDGTELSNSFYYYNIVLQNGTSGGASTSDFNASFPAGATINPGEYQTVSLNGAVNFNTTYGAIPTYELVATDAAVPVMLSAETGSIGATPGLSNSGEVVILYYWNGGSDLVTDLDYVVWGDKAEAVDKTGVSKDGSDANATTTAYNNDVAIADQEVAPVHIFGFSMQRLSADERNQLESGSNGILGANEMSENLSITFFDGLAPSPNVAAPETHVAMTIAEMEVDADGDFVPDRLGQMVEIAGVISTPNLLGILTSHFLDDGTAGTDMFYSIKDSTYHIGDSIRVKGVVSTFAGLTEIIPLNGAADVTLIGSNLEVRNQVVSVSQLKDVNGEEVEGEIVTFDEYVRMVNDSDWPLSIISKDINITNGVDTVLMRLDDDMGLGGAPKACGEFLLTGIVSQFTLKVPPDDNYSVIPRGLEDMVFKNAATITGAVDQGIEILVSFSASLNDTAGTADPVIYYTIWSFAKDGSSENLIDTVTADNSSEYSIGVTNPGSNVHILVIANSASGCGIWSKMFDSDSISLTFLEAKNLDISSDEDLHHITTHNPFITFDFFDSTADLQTAYQIQVSSLPDYSIIDMWDSDTVLSNDTLIAYAGDSLMDGETYYLRVKVANTDFWSSWANLEFRMNSLPSVPITIGPKNLEIVESESPILWIRNASDSELDSIIYEFELTFLLDLFVETWTSPVFIGSDSTFSVFPGVVPDDQVYLWRVRAFDGFEYSNFSAGDSFIVNAFNEPPVNFLAKSPKNDTLHTLLPTFLWYSTTDPDIQDTTKYLIRISRDKMLSNPLLSDLSSDTNYTPNVSLSDDSLFWWSAAAMDKFGLSAYSDTVSFLLDFQEPPESFSLISPSDTSVIDSLRPVFIWQSSSDPDPLDTVRYILNILSTAFSDTGEVVLFSRSGISDTAFSMTEDMEEVSFRWFIVAEDSDEDSLSTQSREIFRVDIITGIDDELSTIPEEFILFQNYPNPFNPQTTISYGLPQQSDVTLIIYNLMGQEVIRWEEVNAGPGFYEKIWNSTNIFGNSVASGIYIYRLIAGDFVQTKKMLLLK